MTERSTRKVRLERFVETAINTCVFGLALLVWACVGGLISLGFLAIGL